MADSLKALLESPVVRNKTEEEVARNVRGAPRSSITSIYSKLCQYNAMYQDTVVARRYSVLRKNGNGDNNEIAVRLAKEEIIFYIMCEKFRGEDAAMDCETGQSKGVKRRSSKRTSGNSKPKKYKLNLD